MLLKSMVRGAGRAALVWVLAAGLFLGAGTAGPAAAKEDKTYKSLKLFTDVLEELEKNYIDEVDTEELIHNAIKGMVGNLDPHSSFMPPEAFDELQDDTKGEFSGIGIVITVKDGILTVISPIEGTPAYDAGVQAGDVIVKINDESTRDMALWEAVNKLRGPRFEEVTVTILREKEKEPLVITLKRDLIPMESVKSAVIEPGYGYLRVTNFRMNTDQEIEQALVKMENQSPPLKGLIIDMRHNPGGLLEQAVRVSDLFLEKGTIVSIKGRQEKDSNVYNARPDEGAGRDYPIVVLINGGSASASEIVAGALQDHHRALILGTTSFGKGSVQTVRPLKDGYGIKYTIARYYTPSGRSIQAKGIEPDITVEHQILPEKEEQESAFDRMLREKDLKNSLEPEKKEDNTGETKKGNDRGSIDLDLLKRDVQVKRALDILISYGVFSKLNGS